MAGFRHEQGCPGEDLTGFHPAACLASQGAGAAFPQRRVGQPRYPELDGGEGRDRHLGPVQTSSLRVHFLALSR